MESNNESELKDSIVEAVAEKMRSRSQIGIKKYGVTLDRKDVSTVQWIDMAIEEQMDNIMYLTRLKKDIEQMEALFHKGKEEQPVSQIIPFSNTGFGTITSLGVNGTITSTAGTMLKITSEPIDKKENNKDPLINKKRYANHR